MKKRVIIVCLLLLSQSAIAVKKTSVLSSDLISCLALLKGMPSGEHFDAVADYFLSGVYVNAQLIAEVDPTSVEPEILSQAQARLGRREFFYMKLNLDEVIQMQNPLSKGLTVFRGTNNHSPRPKQGQMYEVGEIIVFPQFLSTSASATLAQSYIKGVLFEISVPAGVQALDLHKVLGTKQKSGTELVFARNTRVKVTAVVESGDYTLVKGIMQP